MNTQQIDCSICMTETLIENQKILLMIEFAELFMLDDSLPDHQEYVVKCKQCTNSYFCLPCLNTWITTIMVDQETGDFSFTNSCPVCRVQVVPDMPEPPQQYDDEYDNEYDNESDQELDNDDYNNVIEENNDEDWTNFFFFYTDYIDLGGQFPAPDPHLLWQEDPNAQYMCPQCIKPNKLFQTCPKHYMCLACMIECLNQRECHYGGYDNFTNTACPACEQSLYNNHDYGVIYRTTSFISVYMSSHAIEMMLGSRDQDGIPTLEISIKVARGQRTDSEFLKQILNNFNSFCNFTEDDLKQIFSRYPGFETTSLTIIQFE